MPRTVNRRSPERRAERQLAADRDAVLVGELPREDDRVGLRQEHQRIVDDRLVAALEVVVAQAAVAGHVDAEDEQVALARRCCESTTASMTGTATRTAGDACTRLEHLFVEAGLAGRDLQLGLAGNAVDGAC